MSGLMPPEPDAPEPAEHNAPSPVVLLCFTLATGVGLVIAGTWILHGKIAITVVGAFGIVIGAVGLYLTFGRREG